MQFIVRTSDAIAGEQAYVYGGAEDREVLERAFSVIDRSATRGPSAGGALLEIGANIGTTTVAAIRGGYVDRVIAIEAHPGTASLLRQNLIVNGVADRVLVLNAAVTDGVGEVQLALSTVDSGDHRVRSRHDRSDGELASRPHLKVPGTTIDKLIQDQTIDLAGTRLVWIDAQGHEPAILRGGRCLLASPVPVLIEYWPRGLQASGGLEDLEQIISSSYNRFLDLRVNADPAAARPTSQLPVLRDAYADGSFTDLLLIKD